MSDAKVRKTLFSSICDCGCGGCGCSDAFVPVDFGNACKCMVSTHGFCTYPVCYCDNCRGD